MSFVTSCSLLILAVTPFTDCSCSVSSGWFDPFLQRFTFNAGRDCLASCARVIHGVTCCSPQSPQQLNVVFRLQERSGTSFKLSWADINSMSWSLRAQSRYSSLVVAMAGWNDPIKPDRFAQWLAVMADGMFQKQHLLE